MPPKGRRPASTPAKVTPIKAAPSAKDTASTRAKPSPRVDPKPRKSRADGRVRPHVTAQPLTPEERANNVTDTVLENPRQQRKRVYTQLEGKMAQLFTGELSVEDMDDEELARMQFKDKGGHWRGRPPTNLPGVLIARMRAEMRKRFEMGLHQETLDVGSVLGEIALDPEAKPADRLKAVAMHLDRNIGPVKHAIELETGEKGFQVDLVHTISRAGFAAALEEGNDDPQQ